MSGVLLTEAGFDGFDAGLESGRLLLQLSHAALENFPARLLVSEDRFDAAQSLNDGHVLLLEPLEATVDRIEVSEDFGAKLSQLGLEPIEPAIDALEAGVDDSEPSVDSVEAAVDSIEPTVDSIEPTVDSIEPTVHPIEPAVDPVEAPVDPSELTLEKLDELLVLGVRHGPRVTFPGDAGQVSRIRDIVTAA